MENGKKKTVTTTAAYEPANANDAYPSEGRKRTPSEIVRRLVSAAKNLAETSLIKKLITEPSRPEKKSL